MQQMQQQGQQMESKIDIQTTNVPAISRQNAVKCCHLELSSRHHKLNERIQDYATEIERLANLAYIGVPDDVLERLKIDAFFEGLRDAELKKAVWTPPKTTFTETLAFALTQETASVLWTSSMKVRRTEISSENDISDVVCATLRQVLRENKRITASKTRKCYACQKPGHFARECRSKHKGSYSTSPTRNLSEDIMDEVILGMDFMAKHGFVLDMKRQVLQYANVTLPLTVGYDRQAEVLQVVVQRQQKIPPKCEVIVWATATQEIRLSKIWVVEPSKECTKGNIIIGKAVVSPANTGY
uniref:CCHC-type domain-containing protein n=1 Tax=Glossina austeni TaxID=7395 RepID=A0A1A9UD29_GLOAU